VRPSSAAGRGRKRRLPFGDDDGLVLTGLHHFDLLNHPAIYEQIRGWLTSRPALPAATSATPLAS